MLRMPQENKDLMEKVDLINGYPKQSVAHHELLKVVVLRVRGVIVSVLIYIFPSGFYGGLSM